MQMRRSTLPLRTLCGVAAITFLAAAAYGQNTDPLAGYDAYPQFRTLSGLSGGGFGLDSTGWGSLSGATSFTTPMGYVLGHDQFRIGGNFTSLHGGLQHLSSASGKSLKKAVFMYGHTFGRINLAYSYFVKSAFGDASTNLQLGYVPVKPTDPAFSIGVQDIVGHGGSAGTGIPGDQRLSRSIFGAVTMPVPVGTKTLYVSGGWGTRRFNKGFASGSIQLAEPVRIWTEYDGFGFNEGLLFGLRPNALDVNGEPHHVFETDLMIGLVRGKYPTIGLTIGF